ncbi:hypothetical protein B0A52_01493 [Exophiala mesophila]|uniref:DUF2406 domain-containing protein n=1 Tax=Exophiala mesophila TaxID=212818 RepID=A0A438NF50_EXOME|nr:hypothetical protein B0A52_01493 [Exophiala mesophila]
MTTTSPPISPQPHGLEPRPGAQTSMSYTSNRSRRSSASGHKLELTESHKDKKRLHTKADPSRALNEATPAEEAQEHATVDDLRAIMHKDLDGNVITDPDRSNPTRHRMERPLDTIRSFNAAAEGTSSRRSSYGRAPSQMSYNNDSRRASYYSQNGYSPQRPQRPAVGGGYYRNSSYGFGPQNSVEEEPGSANIYGRNMRQTSNPYFAGQQVPQGYQNGYGTPAQFANHDSPTSAHSYQHSYETATSGSDDNSKSTNPSSQNSSNDQLHHLRKPDEYNFFNNDTRFNQPSFGQSQHVPYSSGNPYGPDAVQSPSMYGDQYGSPSTRTPIPLNSPGTIQSDAPPPPPAKRQSWIKRRFSKRET